MNQEQMHYVIEKATEKNAVKINKNRKEYTFKVGDLVFTELSNKLNRKKLDHVRDGPFEILEIVSPHLFRLKINKKKLENNLFHKNKLIPFTDQPN